MIFNLLTPLQGPRKRSPQKCAVARPIHVSNTHNTFGWISSNGLGGDTLTDRRTDVLVGFFYVRKGANKAKVPNKTPAILTE